MQYGKWVMGDNKDNNQQFYTLPGDPSKLGAWYDPAHEGVNFAVFSESAAKLAEDYPDAGHCVYVSIFDKTGENELTRIPMYPPAKESEGTRDEGIWHCFVSGIKPEDITYGYRVDAPYLPNKGHRFNPHKLLMDPYGREFVGFGKLEKALAENRQELFAFTKSPNPVENAANACNPDKMDKSDSAPFMPKTKVNDPRKEKFDWQDTGNPRTPWHETVIYEAHVKGQTKLRPDVPAEDRGKFRGLAHPNVTGHIKKLGVTAIELMPVHMFVNDGPKVNYWGYNSINFFCPAEKYGTAAGLKTAVREAHRKGLEVMLDVVYNHTAEGNEQGPTLSFKGLDNKNYYFLQPRTPKYYINDTGCGNTVNANHPQVARMIMDSLRYYAEEFRIDGFRFDLMYTLGRTQKFNCGFDRNSLLLKSILSDPVLKKAKISGEPWDCHGFDIGGMPEGIYEWNDHKTPALFWQQRRNISHLAVHLAGCSPNFDHPGKGKNPHKRKIQAVTAITTHDGQSLADTVSYREKHNWNNGEFNRDGSDVHGMNGGVEGPSSSSRVREFRLRMAFNHVATLGLSHGPVLLKAGDEIGHTQKGNNNPYCQDNEINWLNWESFYGDQKTDHSSEIFNSSEKQRILMFCQSMLRLRKSIKSLSLRDTFPHGKFRDVHDIKDITWWNPAGEEMNGGHWNENAHCFGMILNNGAIKEARKDVHFPDIDNNSRLLTVFNSHSGWVNFKLPVMAGGKSGWRLVMDTSRTDSPVAFLKNESFSEHKNGGQYKIPPQSTLIFVQEPENKISKELFSSVDDSITKALIPEAEPA
jgi:glycogen operon protein